MRITGERSITARPADGRLIPPITGSWTILLQLGNHILNGERSLSSVTSEINRSPAPSWARTAAVQKITAIVNDANNAANYSNFTSDGWISMADSVFTLNGDSTGWKDGGDGYMYSNGTYSCSFTTHGGYDFRSKFPDIPSVHQGQEVPISWITGRMPILISVSRNPRMLLIRLLERRSRLR